MKSILLANLITSNSTRYLLAKNKGGGKLQMSLLAWTSAVGLHPFAAEGQKTANRCNPLISSQTLGCVQTDKTPKLIRLEFFICRNVIASGHAEGCVHFLLTSAGKFTSI